MSSLPDCVAELQEYKVLNDGNKIPGFGYGTYASVRIIFLLVFKLYALNFVCLFPSFGMRQGRK